MLFSKYLVVLDNFSISNIFDILIMTMAFYGIYLGIGKTRAYPIIKAFTFILFLTFLSAIFELTTINYILEYMVSLIFVAVIVLFPAEIKKILYKIGGQTLFSRFLNVESNTIKNTLDAVSYLKKKKIGALIVFQRRDGLTSLVESGVSLNAVVDPNLIISLFNKESLLHDGAMVISGNRLVAAACYISNLSFSDIESSKMGSRHRAALGLSEQSDAFVVVVSEENGGISLCHEGKMTQQVSLDQLRRHFFREFFIEKSINKSEDNIKGVKRGLRKLVKK